MMRLLGSILIFMFLQISVLSNNVRVTNLAWDRNSVMAQNVLTMTFTVSWEDSWRDEYNYDAAYIFFKFKRSNVIDEAWNHLYLQDAGNEVQDGYKEDYDCWVSPLSGSNANMNTGIYIFRKESGAGGNSVDVTVKWDIKKQIGIILDGSEFADNKILISAFAVEMVYIPRGPFRIGDGKSVNSFRKAVTPILPEYDLVNDTAYNFRASSGNPKHAANRTNDNTTDTLNSWVGTANNPSSATIRNSSYWLIDFGEGNSKEIKYFGVSASNSKPTYYPKTFRLQGGTSPETGIWTDLWVGNGKEFWSTNTAAYPVEKSIKLTTTDNFRCYRLRIDEMNDGYPIVSSIAMTDRELEELTDYTVLIDGKTTPKDSLYYLGARDGGIWTGTVPETFPNGYKGFYAMKYEISQEQYVRFLNKLSYNQQNGLLDGRLDILEEGAYVFGDDKTPDHRNGIIISSKMKGYPAVFANNLKGADEAGKTEDGQNIACNYMSINDMLAYADWAGLRPLTEMEYEKMCRPLYPSIPVKGGYAWNSTRIRKAAAPVNMGAPNERTMTGNANYANADVLAGPLRVGSFASDNLDRENAGAGFWGCLELSGNLAEMYYNVNQAGLEILVNEEGAGTSLTGHKTSHGDGYLNADGQYNNAVKVRWQKGPEYIALRGGSYASDSAQLAVSDRSCFMNTLSDNNDRQSTVSFRLGRSVPENTPFVSILVLENEETTMGTKNVQDVSEENHTEPYVITGNMPQGTNSVYTYIWYMKEYGDKRWRVMEGENNKNLIFDNFRRDTVKVQEYHFRRKIVTPFADSETSSAYEAAVIVKERPLKNK